MPFETPPGQPKKSTRKLNIFKRDDQKEIMPPPPSTSATLFSIKPFSREAAYGARLAEARELLGDRVFGPEEVEKTFGFKPEKIPPIPYSRQDLEKAKELGEMLILRIDKDQNGKPLTMVRIQQLLEPGLVAEGKGKVGYSDWSQSTEPFETQDTLKLEWKLVSMDLIPNSTNKDYIEQTALLRDRFKKNNLATPEELAECTDKRLKEIRLLMKTNWIAASEALSNLLMNKNHRTTPVEDIYDLIVPLKSRNLRRLENVYNWTSRNSGGYLMSVGRFDARGAVCFRWVPGPRRGPVGVCSSR